MIGYEWIQFNALPALNCNGQAAMLKSVSPIGALPAVPVCWRMTPLQVRDHAVKSDYE